VRWGGWLTTGASQAADAPTLAQQVYQRSKFVAELSTCTAAALPPRVLDWAVELVERNVGPLYRDVWEWDAAQKRAELAHVRRQGAGGAQRLSATVTVSRSPHLRASQESGRFLLATRPGSTELLGFLNWRWEQDPLPELCCSDQRVRAVVYVYELQLVPSAQGRGLGSRMMALLAEWVRRDQGRERKGGGRRPGRGECECERRAATR